MSARWPSREEWARRQRTLYADDIRVSKRLSDYASGDEITEAQRGARRALRRDRTRWPLREALEDMRNGTVPIHRQELADVPDLALICERYDAALANEEVRLRAIVESKPIDDEAWAGELERRARLDRILSDPTDAD